MGSTGPTPSSASAANSPKPTEPGSERPSSVGPRARPHRTPASRRTASDRSAVAAPPGAWCGAASRARMGRDPRRSAEKIRGRRANVSIGVGVAAQGRRRGLPRSMARGGFPKPRERSNSVRRLSAARSPEPAAARRQPGPTRANPFRVRPDARHPSLLPAWNSPATAPAVAFYCGRLPPALFRQAGRPQPARSFA